MFSWCFFFNLTAFATFYRVGVSIFTENIHFAYMRVLSNTECDRLVFILTFIGQWNICSERDRRYSRISVKSQNEIITSLAFGRMINTCLLQQLYKIICTIGLIRRIPTLKPLHLGFLNFKHLLAFMQLRIAETFNLITLVVLELRIKLL